MVLMLTEEDVAAVLTPELALRCAEDAFVLTSGEKDENGVRQRVEGERATLNIMGAIAPSLGVMGVKVYPVVRSDVTQGAAFTFQLFDHASGRLEALLAANVLGNRRTAAATAVATRALARPASAVLTVIGAGWVARGQVEAVLRAMPSLSEVLVVGRDPGRAEVFAEHIRSLAGALGRAPAVSLSTAAEAVPRADVVVTATGSAGPVFDGGSLRPGTHVSAVGSNYATKRELDDDAVARADLIAVDAFPVARAESGDLLLHSGGWPERAVEIGSVLRGDVPGRRSEQDVTLFESQGLAMLDLVAAASVVAEARARGLGRALPASLESW